MVKKINLAFLWHMHQPIYIDPIKKRFIMPWLRLHAMQDYLDIPEAILRVNGAKSVINFVPSLLEQLENYINEDYSDDYLEIAKKSVNDFSFEDRKFLINNFFNINFEKVVNKSKRYKELYNKKQIIKNNYDAFSLQELLDLQVHFQLGWSGSKLKENPFIKELVQKDEHFTSEEKEKMLKIQYDFLSEVRKYIKKLAKNKNCEISLTPYYHPIIPVMNDIENVKKSWYDSTVPNNFSSMKTYSKIHIQKAIDYSKDFFDTVQTGMWPAEGTLSKDFIEMLKETSSDIKWVASDEAILSKTLNRPASLDEMSTPYNYNGINIFFRNHTLSDKLGFVYSNWDTQNAVNDFINELSYMRNHITRDNAIISVILDGENAWEYYENHGEEFLSALFERLVETDWIELYNFSDYIDNYKNSIPSLSNLMPGSWIDGNFNTWINEEVKNIYWSHLYKLNVLIENYKKSPSYNEEIQEKIDANFLIAQGSDWMWWAGKGHSSANDKDFDKLFRNYIRVIYDLLEISPPEELYYPLYENKKTAAVYKLPLHFISPNISGKFDSYYGWVSSGEILAEQGAIHKTDVIIKKILFGFNRKSLFFQIIPQNIEKFTKDYELIIDFLFFGKINLNKDERVIFKAFEVCEIEVPFDVISEKFQDNEKIKFRFLLLESGNIIERIPNSDVIEISYPDLNFDINNWYV